MAANRMLTSLLPLQHLVVLQGGAAVQAPLQVAGQDWLVTCVSMGNPHAVVFGTTQGNLKVAFLCCLLHPTIAAFSLIPFQQCSVVREFKSSGATLAYV